MSTFSLPAPDLAHRIDLHWSSSPDGSPGTAFQEFFPDSGVHLVFRLSSSGCRAVLLGPTTERACVELDRRAEYLGIRFRTGQAPRLADVRCSELTDRHVELTRIGGIPVEAVAERLRAAPDLASRQRVLEEVVRGEVTPLLADARCRRAALLLDARGGALRIDALAAEVGLHVRSLERLFVDQLGIAPKRLARLVRLRHVLGGLHSGGHRNLAELALACGYSDQPHLIRDFRELMGRRPGEPEASRSRRIARAETRIVHRYRP
jgi:AraC-like DNA-binding protein